MKNSPIDYVILAALWFTAGASFYAAVHAVYLAEEVARLAGAP